jgi:small subunit ribosomal protein S1
MLAEFEPSERSKGPRVGEMVSGTVINIGAQSVFVDLGGKSEGVLELEEVLDADGSPTVAVGDSIDARVVEVDGKAGCIVLRRGVTRGADAAEALQGSYEHRMPVEGLVSGVNKGGLEVQIAGLRAFCPISQIDNRFVEDANHFVGQKLTFLITRLEAGRGKNVNIVVSRRILLEEEAAAQAAQLRERLREGLVVRGQVSSLKDYGAFVDLGGLEGMLHISELGHSRVNHPSEVLSVGQEIDVQILKIEPATDARKGERISLSMKSMQESPWQDAARSFREGQRVTGTVVRLQPFGAFVEIAPGLEGLVHISELGAGRRINHPREVTAEGARVEVTVLSVDPARQRLSLSMKDPDQIPDERADRAAVAEVNAAAPKSLGTFADLLKDKV